MREVTWRIYRTADGLHSTASGGERPLTGWKKHVVRFARETSIDTLSTTYACFPNSIIAPMYTVQTSRRIPDLQFRVLILGRANSGKTSILQRVCDTTWSPTIYRRGDYGQMEEVRGPRFVCESDLTANQFKLEPSMDVSDTRTPLRMPIDIVQARRAHHQR